MRASCAARPSETGGRVDGEMVIRRTATWLLIPALAFGAVISACGDTTDEVNAPRPKAPEQRQAPTSLVLAGGVPPVNSPTLRDVVEIQAWSDSALLDTTNVTRWPSRSPRRFSAHAPKDSSERWSLQGIPEAARVLCIQQRRRGAVVRLAKSIALFPAPSDPVPVEWIPEDEMAAVTCMAYFAEHKQSRNRFVARWNGLPLPANDSNGFVTRLTIPADTDVEVTCSGWARASDYGLPAPVTTRQPPGTTGKLRFELPSGRTLFIRAVTVDGRSIPSRFQTWRIGEDGAYHPWSRVHLHQEGRVQVVPGRYGALVQSLKGGSGWKTFVVDQQNGRAIELKVRVQEQGPRMRVVFRQSAGTRDEIDVVRIDHVDAPSPEAAAFWLGRTRSSTLETGTMPPGEYDLLVRCGTRWWTRRVRVDGVGTSEFTFDTPQEGDPALHASGSNSLVIEVDSPTDARPHGTWVVVSSVDRDEPWDRARPVTGDSALFTGLAAGRYEASVRQTWRWPFATPGVSETVTMEGKGPQQRVRLSPPGVEKDR